MAEIVNLDNQLKIIGTSGEFNDSIRFYNKQNNVGDVVLSVRAQGGKLILTNKGNDVESFTFSDVTVPSTSDLDALTLTVHQWIYDSIAKKNIDTVFTSATGNPDELRVSKTYDFIPSKCQVYINDSDMEDILSVFNETEGKILYNKGSEQYTGDIVKNVLTYHRRVQGMTKDNILYIIYKSKNVNSVNDSLNRVLTEIEESVRQQKITNLILTESTEVDIFKDQIQL